MNVLFRRKVNQKYRIIVKLIILYTVLFTACICIDFFYQNLNNYSEEDYEVLKNVINQVIVKGKEDIYLSKVPVGVNNGVNYNISRSNLDNVVNAEFSYKNATYYLQIGYKNRIIYMERNYNSKEEYVYNLKKTLIIEWLEGTLLCLVLEMFLFYEGYELVRFIVRRER